ncbi:MAG: glycerate kinase [Actinomycetota bacterium]|nr:glycerate kinase [Actinomycetota bacterium]
MRVVIATDKFRGSFSARQAAATMASALRECLPTATIYESRVADGGEGTLEVLLSAVGGRESSVEVAGPLGDPVGGRMAVLANGWAVIEMATASGLDRLTRDRRDALRASSTGTGELIRAAIEEIERPARLIVCIGGSASTDGGVGAATAIGWRFLDRGGRGLSPGGGFLTELASIGRPHRDFLEGISVTGACDVDSPLTGLAGAARVYAPQKGATAGEIARLERALETLAARISSDLDIGVAGLPGAGAGGGMGAGLVAFFGGELVPGVDLVAEAVGLKQQIEKADLVITGEGSLDGQSLRGKCAVGVARIASAAGVDCVAVAGRVAVERAELQTRGISVAVDLTEHSQRSDAEALKRATCEAVQSWSVRRPS